ncbi:unnamed protein product, partial [Staurois parvus]
MYCPQSRSSPVLSAVSGHSLYCVQQSLVIPCTVCSLWSFPVLSAVSGHPNALSAVSGHSLHCVRSLNWSSPALCPQSLVIECTVSAKYFTLVILCDCVRSPLVISCTVSAVYRSS